MESTGWLRWNPIAIPVLSPTSKPEWTMQDHCLSMVSLGQPQRVGRRSTLTNADFLVSSADNLRESASHRICQPRPRG